MPADEEYRRQVQGKVQDLLSERHEKPTLKLVVEAVVEGVKLYRNYKEDKLAEGKEKRHERGKHNRSKKEVDMGDNRRDGHKKHSGHDGHGHSHESSGRRRHHHHHHSSQDERRSRLRYRHRDESPGKPYDRSSSRDRRSRSHRQYEDNDIRDPVTENPLDNDSEYQVIGGAGPADTLHDGNRNPNAPLPRDGNHPGSKASGYQTSWRDLLPERKKSPSSKRRAPTPHRSARRPSNDRSRARSDSRGRKATGRRSSRTPHRPHRRNSRKRSSSSRHSRQRDKQSDYGARHADSSRSPTRRQRGPDGTPFGSLPVYKRKAGIALGFGDHVMNTYRHIQAEHDAGFRTKGKLETALDEMRKKKTDKNFSCDKPNGGQTREREKIRKSEPERVRWAEGYPVKSRGDERKPKAAVTEEEERRRSKQASGRRKEDVDQRKIRSPPVLETRVQPPTSTGTPHRQPPPVVREISHPVPPNRPPPEPPQWQHAPPQRPLPIREEEREVSPPREPSMQGADDLFGKGAAGSHYHQAPYSPMPGSYEEDEQAEDEGYDQAASYDEVPRPDTPPSPIIPPYPDTPPSPVVPEDPSGSSSPIMSHAPRAASPPPRFTPTFLPNIPMLAPPQLAPPIPPLPPLGLALPAPTLPPAPPLPVARPPNNGGMAALLGDIQSGSKLRKVAHSDKREYSENPRAGRVVYEETAHSHDVEEHERAQAREANNQSPFCGNSTWSTRISMDEDDDVRPKSNKAFQDDLARAIQARRSGSGIGTPATGPWKDSDDGSLTVGSRASMIAIMSGNSHDEKAPVQRLCRSESGKDLIFTLAEHIAQPGWNSDDPNRRRQ